MGINEDHPFLHGTTLKKFEGKVYQIYDMEFRPTKIKSEYLHAGVTQREATFDAENVQTGEQVTLKLFTEYSLIHIIPNSTTSGPNLTRTGRSDPTHYFASSQKVTAESVRKQQSFGLRIVRNEVLKYQKSSSLGYTPDCIAYTELQQDDRYEYPGGYLYVLVLSKNPNRTLNARNEIIARRLKTADLKVLSKRCEEMYRAFRDRGLFLGMNIWTMEYDPETMKPYV